MTKMLEQMVARAAELTEEQQDELAALMLSELDSDAAWESSFAKTTDEQWRDMADRVRQQIREGQSTPFDPDAL